MDCSEERWKVNTLQVESNLFWLHICQLHGGRWTRFFWATFSVQTQKWVQAVSFPAETIEHKNTYQPENACSISRAIAGVRSHIVWILFTWSKVKRLSQVDRIWQPHLEAIIKCVTEKPLRHVAGDLNRLPASIFSLKTGTACLFNGSYVPLCSSAHCFASFGVKISIFLSDSRSHNPKAWQHRGQKRGRALSVTSSR